MASLWTLAKMDAAAMEKHRESPFTTVRKSMEG